MNIDWKNKLSGNTESLIYFEGSRYVARIWSNNEYILSKVISPSFVKLPAARKDNIIHGYANSNQEAREVIEKYFNKNEKIEEEIIPVKEEVKEEQPVVKNETVEIQEEKTEVISEQNKKEIILTISNENNVVSIKSNVEDVVIRYTTNGKDVKATNKIYKGDFEVESPCVVKAIAFKDEEQSVQYEKNIEF